MQFAPGRSPPASLGSDGTYTLRILHVDTSALREALDEAHEAYVDTALAERMERRLKEAKFAQQGLSMGMARFVGKLHSMTSKRKRRDAAKAALAAASRECDDETARLRRLRPPHSLLEGSGGRLEQLMSAIEQASVEGIDVEAARAALDVARELSELRGATAARLASAVTTAVDATEMSWKLTQQEMTEALRELVEVQKLAEAALVSRDADEFAQGALQRLQQQNLEQP